MPVSRGRKKKNTNAGSYAPNTAVAQVENSANPQWFLPLLVGLMVLGLAWIVVFYLTAGSYRLPIPGIGNWNLAIGFALILAGFSMTTRWR